MILLRFRDAVAERRGLGFLAGCFTFTTRADGVTLVSELALAALARENIPFIVEGQARYSDIIGTHGVAAQ